MVDTQLPDGTENDLTAGADPDPFITPLRNALMPDPGWTYGNQLPIKLLKDPATGQILDQDFGIPTGLRDFGNGILDLLQGTKTGEVTGDATRALAGLAIGKGLAAGPVGDDATATIFGGRGATAESLPGGKVGAQGGVDTLMTAMKMDAAGEDPWHSTGWFRDRDGQWKFEIPDQGAEMNILSTDARNKISLTEPTKLGDLMQHDKLFDAYPELKNTMIKPLDPALASQGILGMAHQDGSISIAPGNAYAVKSTLLHEIQHQVQDKEGFAVGGDAREFLPADHAEQMQLSIQQLNYLNDQMKFVKNADTGGAINPTDVQIALSNSRTGNLSPMDQSVLKSVMQDGLLSPYLKAQDNYRNLYQASQDAFKKYQSLGGEVEARNVQARADMSHPSDVHPHTTPGYPQGPQLMRFYIKDANGEAMAAEPVESDPFVDAYATIKDNLKQTGWNNDPAAGNQNAGPVGSIQDAQNARIIAKIKSDNLKDLVNSGYYPAHQLNNGYSIARSGIPQDPTDARFFGNTSHALVSPNGTPVLYGSSPADLLKRGFYPEDNVSISGPTNGLPERFSWTQAAAAGWSKDMWDMMSNNLMRKVAGRGRDAQDLIPKE